MRIVLVFLMLMAVSLAGVSVLASQGRDLALTGAVPAGGAAPTGAQSDSPVPAPVAPGETVTFTIQPGETTGSIAGRLAQVGLVRNATIFRIRVQWRGAEGKLQAGEYQLRQGIPEDELIEVLQQAKAKDVAITFIEGRRIEEFAEALENANVGIDAKRFLELARRGTFAYDFLESRPAGATLEGFLFPDTYRVIPGKTTPEELIHQMLKRFGDTFTPQLREQARRNTGLSVYEVVTLASIVEREAQVREERPRIAAAYLNRLRDRDGLYADPTIQYAVGKAGDWWPVLRDQPRNIVPQSPYNTYVQLGLPPSPIANPGASSLRAVAEPEKVDYKYFVRNDLKNDGSHVFARTLAEHERNRAQYQRPA
jgi:UPF0755 protein